MKQTETIPPAPISRDIQVRGRSVSVNSFDIQGQVVVLSGGWLRTASIMDAEFVQHDLSGDLDGFVGSLKQQCRYADIFTFFNPIGTPDITPNLHVEWDNVAVADSADYQKWWESLPQEARKNSRRAAKRGVEVRLVEFDRALASGIKAIYDESPLRQGRRFWHYMKDLDKVMQENGTYREQSEFIGAYFEGQLIGFMKFVYVGNVARIMQILAMSHHADKRPMNAMLTKAMERCGEKQMRYLIYGKYTYGNKVDSSIAEFKRRMGFTQLDFPRYYHPLSTRGSVALSLGLHRRLVDRLPPRLYNAMLAARTRWLTRRSPSTSPEI